LADLRTGAQLGGGSLFAGLVSPVMLMAWMNPTLSALVNAQDATISLRQVQATLHQWTIVNWAAS
jgi:hypothetical protein